MEENPLPNDTCSVTRDLENQFILRHQLKPYVYHEDGNCCVLYSRTTNTAYEWPTDRALRVKDLDEFREIGHTLGIDYVRTFFRKFAIDIDCLCRKLDVQQQQLQHCNTVMVNLIKIKMISLLTNFASGPIEYTVWSRGCGFHIYTNVDVSMPTHLRLAYQLHSEFSGCVIEVPSKMPLPCSAKDSGCPYRPMLPNANDADFELIPCYDSTSFFDLYQLGGSYVEGASGLKVETATGDLYLNFAVVPDRRYGVPKFSRIIKIGTIDPFLRQYADYLTFVSQQQPQPVALGERDLADLDPEFRSRLDSFMLLYNRRFLQSSRTDCEAFVEGSLTRNGGLYLQPYIVMLHKAMEPIELKDMILVLRTIYSRELDDPCLERFLRYYDRNTYISYIDTYESMLDHLCYLYTNQISATMSLNERIQQIMCMELSVQSHEAFVASLERKERAQKQQAVNKVLDVYIEILVKLQVIMYNSSSMYYYVLDDNHYRMCTKPKKLLPTVIFNWVGVQRRVVDDLHAKLEMARDRFIVRQTILFSESKFQFATTVGTFNSLTGMYTAKTRFLRYNCYRDVAIWRLHTPYEMYERQNYDVLDRLNATERFTRIMHEDVGSLFVHFLLAPALIQLRWVMFVDEYRIIKLMDLMTRYEDLSSAYFLVEYFPIDPKFIYLLMLIYRTYDGFNTMRSYQAMADAVLNYNKRDRESWRAHFEEALATVTYDEHDSYMDTLLSLRGHLVSDVSREFCLYMTVLAVCVVKCQAFAPFVEAFGVTEIPKPRKTPSEYDDSQYRMNIGTCRDNMHRAIRILFGDQLSVEDRNVIVTMFSISMSTYFDPIATTELLSSLSFLFVPYNKKKKIFVYHGNGDNGKSFICNLIQKMASPKVGRFSNLTAAMERANVTLKNNVTILNEIRTVDASKIKTVTGNDPESTKQFFSQEYEMFVNQSLLYGATNSIIQFKGSNADVDFVSVNRFHVIQLKGQQNHVTTKMPSLLAMLTNEQVYNGTIEASEDDLANAMSFLSYQTYLLRRDDNLFATVDEDNVHSKCYRDQMYRNNNKLYNFLVHIGISEARGFSILAERLSKLVNRCLSMTNVKVSASSLGFDSFAQFRDAFHSQYGIMLQDGVSVPNLAENGLLMHIFSNMSVQESAGSVLTKECIERQVKTYHAEYDKDNARSFFQRENVAHYDYRNGVYKNIKFKFSPIEYSGNEIDDSEFEKYRTKQSEELFRTADPSL